MYNFYNQLARIISNISKKLNLKKNITNKLIYNVGLNGLLSNKKFYESTKNINESELKIYSQNGEDGIIDFLLYKLRVSKPNFVEIGVGEYIESNTRFLYERFYQRGLIIDCIKNLEQKVFSNLSQWKGDLKVLEKFVTSENILITRERHRQNLKNCVQHLEKFQKKKSSKDFDKAAEDLRLATRHLGMIVGKVDVEELLGSIFNDFCIGK